MAAPMVIPTLAASLCYLTGVIPAPAVMSVSHSTMIPRNAHSHAAPLRPPRRRQPHSPKVIHRLVATIKPPGPGHAIGVCGARTNTSISDLVGNRTLISVVSQGAFADHHGE